MRQWIIIISLSLSMATSPVLAQSPSFPKGNQKNLKKLIRACDKTLTACDKNNKAKDKVIGKQKVLILQLDKDLQHEKKKKNSFWNSKELWFVLGAVFTGVIAIGAR